MQHTSFIINNKIISALEKKVYIIAEIGNNHNGSIEKAKTLIDQAVEIGVDCVKFQMRDLNEVYRATSLKKSGDDLSTEYTIDLLTRFELTTKEQIELKKYCDNKEITYLCTPWDLNSLQQLEIMGVTAYKVASADLTNLPLIDAIIATKKPFIISSGMSSEIEIDEVIAYLKKQEAPFAILHCNSTYPAPFHSINLKYIASLQKKHDLIGYSGHERGTAISLGAVALGAKIIERHFTLDRKMEGPDHAASLEYLQMKELVKGIRELEEGIGEGGIKEVSQGQMINKENLAKSIVAKKNLKKGHIITRNDLIFRSPGQGLSPLFVNKLVGQTLGRNIHKEGYFFQSDLGERPIEARAYKFKRPWGIPVRYHDFEHFVKGSNLDLIEFHLSYSDMTLEMDKFLKGPYDFTFVMHAPELFEKSHLMDLATPNNKDRAYSIRETQKVIDITRALKKYFPKTRRPLIVANIGGFTMDKNLDENLKEQYYERFALSIKELDCNGVEIIPQTMAPFPWHFGGQRYQNLFVTPEEIIEKCKKYNLRMCLDVSHSKLTCNHLGISFSEFIKSVGPYTAHIHLGDAKGIDGEGLQVGDGEIDFRELAKILDETTPHSSFIPEIWQGHKNNGEGFWKALDTLEQYF